MGDMFHGLLVPSGSCDSARARDQHFCATLRCAFFSRSGRRNRSDARCVCRPGSDSAVQALDGCVVASILPDANAGADIFPSGQMPKYGQLNTSTVGFSAYPSSIFRTAALYDLRRHVIKSNDDQTGEIALRRHAGVRLRQRLQRGCVLVAGLFDGPLPLVAGPEFTSHRTSRSSHR